MVTLGSVFLLPFTYRGARPLTLYEVAGTVVEFWREIQKPEMALSFIFIAVFGLLVLAGLTGFFSLVSGLISISSMTVMSFSLFFLGSHMVVGLGYYVLWAVSVAILSIGVWRIKHQLDP